MIRPTLTLCLLILLYSPALSAQVDLSGRWTNGWYEFFTKKPKDSIWSFEGADLHEGGYQFRLKATGDSSYLMMDREDGFPPSIGKKDDRVAYKIVDGHRLLLLLSPSGAIEDIYRTIDNSQTMFQIISAEKIAYELSGIFRDQTNGKEVIFDPDQPRATGLLETPLPYFFAISYGFPKTIIRFEDGPHYWYVRTDSTLELYALKGSPDDEDSWVKGRKLRTLKRTGWPDQTDGRQPGKYGFASERPMTPMALAYFSAAERRIMRNEIYARHGYIFKSPDLQTYFTAQPWYKPVEGVGEAQLTELEKLNARTIADHPAPRHR